MERIDANAAQPGVCKPRKLLALDFLRGPETVIQKHRTDCAASMWFANESGRDASGNIEPDMTFHAITILPSGNDQRKTDDGHAIRPQGYNGILMTPRVSVILPFHNAEATLEECLDSVRNQTLREFEIIAVDDGSTDGSTERIRRCSREDPRFRLLQPGRIGLVAAMNLGVARSQGALVARMDADDLMRPERLAVQKAYLLENPHIALVSCQVTLFPADRIRSGYREYVRWQNLCLSHTDIADNLFVESPHAHPSVMFRRPVFDSLGGYREGDFPEDYDLWLRMAEAGHAMAKVPRVLLDWRESPDRLSRTDPRYGREAFDRLRARYLSRDPRVKDAGELCIWGAGRTTRKRVRRLLDLGIHHSGWIDIDPRKIGKTIWGRPVHSPHWLDRNPHPFVLIYVTNHGAREEIEENLHAMGYHRGSHYLAVG